MIEVPNLLSNQDGVQDVRSGKTDVTSVGSYFPRAETRTYYVSNKSCTTVAEGNAQGSTGFSGGWEAWLRDLRRSALDLVHSASEKSKDMKLFTTRSARCYAACGY